MLDQRERLRKGDGILGWAAFVWEPLLVASAIFYSGEEVGLCGKFKRVQSWREGFFVTCI